MEGKTAGILKRLWLFYVCHFCDIMGSSRPEIRPFLFCFQSLEPIVCSLYVRWMDGWMDEWREEGID